MAALLTNSTLLGSDSYDVYWEPHSAVSLLIMLLLTSTDTEPPMRRSSSCRPPRRCLAKYSTA
jgi:hypothetical protein